MATLDTTLQWYKPSDYTFPLRVIPIHNYLAGYPLEIPLELWYAKGSSTAAPINNIAISSVFGTTNPTGKDISDNGYFTVSVDSAAYVSLSSGQSVKLGTMVRNTHKDVTFKISLPDYATTSGIIVWQVKESGAGLNTIGYYSMSCNSSVVGTETGTTHGYPMGMDMVGIGSARYNNIHPKKNRAYLLFKMRVIIAAEQARMASSGFTFTQL